MSLGNNGPVDVGTDDDDEDGTLDWLAWQASELYSENRELRATIERLQRELRAARLLS